MNGDKEIEGDFLTSPTPLARIIPIISFYPLISIHLHIYGLMKRISNSSHSKLLNAESKQNV